MALWTDADWLGASHWDNTEAQSRLETAGYTVTGWLNGKPQIDPEPSDEEWETIQGLCDGSGAVEAPKKGRRRK